MTRLSRRQVAQGMGTMSLGLLAACARLPWQTQPAMRVPRIGWLSPFSPESDALRLEWFREGLAQHGWMEGRNIRIDVRHSEDRNEPLPALAAELVALPVDIIVTVGGFATRAASEATTTIPIVFTTGGAGPPGLGASTARPRGEGNVTGITTLTAPLSGKRLELLKNAVPQLARVAVFFGEVTAFQETERAAGVLGLELYPVQVRETSDIEGSLTAVRSWGADGLMFESHPLFIAAVGHVASFALEHRIAGMYGLSGFVDAGGLMEYAPKAKYNFNRAGAYVDHILRGAVPADLPVEQPREFEFRINLRTAHALGLTIPHHVLLQATEVIQ
jgi:putative tryptophan/tyrosine transport system substrate-binding protein